MKAFTNRGVKNVMIDTMKFMKEQGKIGENNIMDFAFFASIVYNTLVYAPDDVVEEMNVSNEINDLIADIIIPDVN